MSIRTSNEAFYHNFPFLFFFQIFCFAVADTGALPALSRLSRVCSLWRQVAISPSLWRVVDLSKWPSRERQRTEINLKWLIEHRLLGSLDLNLSNWKIKNVDCVFEKLLDVAPNLEGISLGGWKELTSDQLLYLVEEFKKLSRLDLSSINVCTRCR